MSGPSSAETAASFGYSVAFFNSNSELKNLLKQATAGAWSPARFVAALQNTKWFRTSSESFRKYTALKSSDPATFSQQIASGTAHVLNVANELGANVPNAQAQQLADLALKVGWTDEQLRRYMTMWSLKTDKNGYFGNGKAAALQASFRQLASDYGITVSPAVMTHWVRQGLLGGQDEASIRNSMVEQASSKYVALADRIRGGETVRQIADPYIQSYGKVLETNPDNIKLDDPLLQRALMAKDKKGKPTTQTLWDFEQTLRNDPRWKATQNAQDTMSATANSILKTFGLVG